MSPPGKYVRAPSVASSWVVSDTKKPVHKKESSGKYVRAPPRQRVEMEEESFDEAYDVVAPDHQKEIETRVKELENLIEELTSTRNGSNSGNPAAPVVSSSRVSSGAASESSNSANPATSVASSSRVSSDAASEGIIRWDSIKPFPKNVAAPMLWEAWMCFIEDFEIATSLSNVKNPARRVELLLLSMGEDLRGIVRAAKLRPSCESDDCYKIFVDNINQYLRSMTDPAAQHEMFSNMRQEEGESAVNFHARLTRKVQLCHYSPDDQENFVRLQLLRGLRNQRLKDDAQMYAMDATFIVQSATRFEGFKAEAAPLEIESNALRAGGSGNRSSKFQPKRRMNKLINPAKRFKSNSTSFNAEGAQGSRRSRCPRCLRASHRGEECPAMKKNCYSCGQSGHFAMACRRDRVNMVKDEVRPSSSVIDETHEQQVNALSLQDVLVDCRVGLSSSIKFMIDSGSDVNVIGGADWDILEKELRMRKVTIIPNRNSPHRLQAYAADKPIQIECSFKATIEAIGLAKPVVLADFLVVKSGKRSLLGRVTASDMELLKVGNMINNCESGLFPKMPGVKIKFSVDDTVPPVRNAYYNIPAAYRDRARQRLEEMEVQGIIEKVTSAPRWISGMSAVPKGADDFRLVVNMRGPNKAIKREYFRMPLIQEMKVKLHGARFFTKLDLSNAFYHLELSEESRDLTTFLSESGMYRFTRLMFGVNCAPEIFQREMMRILKGVKNKIVYIDDVLLYAETIEELRKIVAEVLEILRSNNLSLNTAKCEFDRTHVTFLGHKLDEKGFNIDELKVRDIQKFRQPTTASELRSFLGLASFVSPYIKNFADISSPLWAVATTQNWSWGKEQEDAFELVKDRIVHATVALGYFSELDTTFLYTDASPKALGAVLVQQDKDGAYRIISFASKSLTATERKYAQNQREALAAVWAVEHFSYFLLGRHFVLRTDAQGMTFILSRCREESKRALTRADGWALRLSPYDYEVEYIRGHENIADPSSRLYKGVDEAFNEKVSPWEVCHLETRSIEFLTEEEIRESTKKDDILQQVICSIETGRWPKSLLRFKAVAGDLFYTDGILIKNGCAVVPTDLREKALEVAHAGHPLEAKFKSILRKRVWWPGMAGDAEKWVKSCVSCTVNGRPERPTPMQRAFAPKAVWDTIALDFNGPYLKLGGISILVVIDLRSRYAIARPVKSTKFEYTKTVLEDVFDRGFPRAIKSDNGPPFNGEDYARYCSERGIQVIFSTPFYPQQNGLVEGFMKVVNKAMSCALSSGSSYQKELQAAVRAYNAADHSTTKLPPEEILTGRKIKRGLPLLKHEKSNHSERLLDARDREAKLQSKEREDTRRGARASRVKPGDTVIVERQTRAKGESRFATKRYVVMEENNGSLVLCDPEGQKLRRHISQTKKVQQWRGPKPPVVQEAKQRSNIDGSKDVERLQRPAREKKPPSYLSEYVRLVEEHRDLE